MYKINRQQNNIEKLDERLFSDLKIREREHLQEWIAKNPETLGEELLIIQKEYNGFNNTNERLDLLALDKEGGLVIIENKLDDTGRNVVWQALKYTSYCSTLSTPQIIKMYQEYLSKIGSQEDAKESILEFLEWEGDELLLNRKEQDQRIIFVANNYRKEVTSTVLWLLNHDVLIQCFRATPYSMGEDLFLQIEQIIPLPETKEFMIDAKQKDKDEKGISKTVSETKQKLFEFWTLFKQNLEKHNNHFLDTVSARKSFSIGTYKGRGRFTYCIGKHTLRVELYMGWDNEKVSFDAMYKYKEAIEKDFGEELTWQRLDNKKATRIKFDCPKEIMDEMKDWNNEEDREKQFEWFRTSMERFYSAVYPYWEKINL